MDFDDYLAIQNLLGRYGHSMDESSSAGGDWEWMRELFIDDAVFDLTPMGGPELIGIDNIIAAWSEGVHPFGHHVTNCVIEPAGEDRATCATKLIVILADGRSNTGYYKDEVVRSAQAWKFRRRTCLVRPFDSSASAPVFAIDIGS